MVELPVASPAAGGVRERIDAIESGYEFLMAYAAQGLKTDAGSKSGGELRAQLAMLEEAVSGIAKSLREGVAERDDAKAALALVRVVERDARASLAALRLVSSQGAVSSQLVDNLNANVHFRALLTGLFLLDEVLDPLV
ncbi:MAG: hypothetical protein J4G12_07205 [Gemmatimonadetes bacterium]|nr:hypothetical protein [Gemmatimonadota bacterium]